MSNCRLYNNPERDCSAYPNCKSCVHNVVPLATIPMWRRAKAGRSFGKDTIVLYDGDPDPRLVKCAVNDCIYIHVDDLKKLPIDEQK